MCVNFMIKEREFFSAFIDGDFDDHIEGMKQTGI